MKSPRPFRHRMILVLVSVFLLTGVSKCDTESSKQSSSDDLIEAFAQGCNMGPWTRAAVNRSMAITSVLESLLQKASCKDNPNLQRAIFSAQAIHSEMVAMNADENLRKERQYEEATQDLLLALQKPGLDADSRYYLASYYASARYELSVARANATYDRSSYQGRALNGLANVSTHFSDLMAASRALADCYKDNPSVAVQVGASIAELGGSFGPPIVGLGASAVAGLMKLGVEAARTMPISSAIYESHRARIPTSLSCGLEALTRDYCKARDASILLDIVEHTEKHEPLPFFKGIDLQDRQLPVLYRWLDRVVNGGDNIKDNDQARKINEQFSRIYGAQKTKRFTEGLIANTRTDMDAIPSQTGKIDQIRKMLRTLAQGYFNCGQESNGRELRSCSDDIYYQIETTSSFILKLTVPNPVPVFDGYVDLITKLNLSPADFEPIVLRVNQEFDSHYVDIVREFNEKVYVDTSTLVRDASRVTPQGLSPLNSIQKLFDFLDHYSYEEGANGARDRILIPQIRAKIQAVYNELIDTRSVSDQMPVIPCPPGTAPGKVCYDVSPSAKMIALTYDTFRLDKNNVFLPGVLGPLVATDLTTRYFKGEGPKEIDELFGLASADLSLMMSRSGITPVVARQDISGGQSITMSSLKQFRDFYASFLAQSMTDLKKAADEALEPEVGKGRTPNRDALSRVCILTLISGMEWPKDVDPSVCVGTRIISKEAKLTLEFGKLNSELQGKPFDDRVCAFEDFLRADNLANLDLKKPGERGHLSLFGIDSIFGAARDFWQQLFSR